VADRAARADRSSGALPADGASATASPAEPGRELSRRRRWGLTRYRRPSASRGVTAARPSCADQDGHDDDPPPRDASLPRRACHIERDGWTLREVLVGCCLRDRVEPERVRPCRAAHRDAKLDDHVYGSAWREVANALSDHRQPLRPCRFVRLRQQPASKRLRACVRDRERHLRRTGLIEHHSLGGGDDRKAGQGELASEL
jgi:hypothetical protein